MKIATTAYGFSILFFSWEMSMLDNIPYEVLMA
jgi:hypothetical protein